MKPPRLALLTALIFPACSHHTHVQAARYESEAAGVRVAFKDVAGEVFKFKVHNESKEVLVVDRDAVHLQTPAGVRSRESGGMENTYTLQPGTSHDLFVKFDTGDLGPGTQVQVDFGTAFTLGGKPVHVDPMAFTILE